MHSLAGVRKKKPYGKKKGENKRNTRAQKPPASQNVPSFLPRRRKKKEDERSTGQKRYKKKKQIGQWNRAKEELKKREKDVIEKTIQLPPDGNDNA